MDIKQNIQRFEKLMSQVKRPGMDKLMEFIRNSDFYEAPASTKYHLSVPGGLLQHSLNTYYALTAKLRNPVWRPILEDIPEESLILCALCHDLCKAEFYKLGYRNQKNYDPKVVAEANLKDRKRDGLGEFVWETVNSYEVDEKLPLGHGDKSALLLQRYVQLHDYELLAIRWHMGFADDKALYNAIGNAFEISPFSLAIHESDCEASKIFETENEKLIRDYTIMWEEPIERPRPPQRDDEECPFD